MNILVNKMSNKVEGINSLPTPFQYSIDVPDDFTLVKSVEVQEGDKQKTNELGEKLYEKDIYRPETIYNVVGQDETIEVTSTPIMLTVQKKDSQGHLLYLEPLIENGEIIDYAEVTNSVDEDGTPLDPSTEQVQKTSLGGRPLYYKDIIEEEEIEVFDHTEEVTEETDRPIMIPNIITKTVTPKDPDYFTVEEVLQAKYSKLIENSSKDYIIADMFLNEEDLDLADPNHSANTGIALVELLPNGGQVKTKTIQLATPTTNFELLEYDVQEGVEIYLGGKKFVDGKVTFTSPISNCTIKFINTTNKPKLIKSYAVAY